MSAVTLSRPSALLDWLRIRLLYRKAFPVTERKPFAMIRRMYRQGRTDVWLLKQDSRFAGFATTINGEGLILIDYLAVPEKQRGQGVGSGALQALVKAYPGCGLFVEIESPFEEGSDQPDRIRRRAFYRRCGFEPSRTMASVFGVPMELLGHGCTVSYETYHAFYCMYYNQWAGAHITPLPHPEA